MMLTDRDPGSPRRQRPYAEGDFRRRSTRTTSAARTATPATLPSTTAAVLVPSSPSSEGSVMAGTADGLAGAEAEADAEAEAGAGADGDAEVLAPAAAASGVAPGAAGLSRSVGAGCCGLVSPCGISIQRSVWPSE